MYKLTVQVNENTCHLPYARFFLLRIAQPPTRILLNLQNGMIIEIFFKYLIKVLQTTVSVITYLHCCI